MNEWMNKERKYGIFDSNFKSFWQSCNRGKKVNGKKEKVFWEYAANLLESTHAEMRFQ